MRAPERAPARVEAPEREDKAERSEGPGRLLCRACGEPITSRSHQTSVAGSHVHHRTNPVGSTFTFGCFSFAPGATAVGPATDDHSWFVGCVWSFAMCGGCGEHLGWLFVGNERFHGLILERLVEEQRAPQH